MKRGEIRWYRFQSPDKQRPVLLLTRDSALSYLGEVTVAPITSTIRGIPSEVPLSKSDGMPRPCAINLDHLQTVTKSRLGPTLTSLHLNRWAEVEEALHFALGFQVSRR
jgi:mRNA interferase MazF